MARPTKPKDLKPKMEGEAASPAASTGGGGGGGFDLKFIILIVVVLLASILGSAGSAFIMATMFIVPEISKAVQTGGPHPEGEAEAHHGGPADPASTETPGHQIGMNLELDEFKVNLKSDPSLEGSQFLAAKMALSIKVPEKENCYAHAEGHASLPPSFREGGVIAGAAIPTDPTLLASEGEGPSCEDSFKTGMSKYVPTMRDIINAALMKRTATVLATLEGQETLKDEIKEQLNQILAPDYEVLRVNFQDFIIQK